MPGVVAVYHAGGDDLGLPSFQGFAMMPATLNRPIFATGKVRFVGDIVAAVVAETKSQAGRRGRRGRRRVRAVAGRSPPRWPAWTPTRRCCSPSTAPTCASAPTSARTRDPLAGADAVAEVTMVSQRLAGVPMENNGIVAVPADGGLTMLGVAPGAALASTAPTRRCSGSTRRSCASCARGSAAGSARRPRGYVEHLVAAKIALTLEPSGEVGRDAVPRTWSRSCTVATS